MADAVTARWHGDNYQSRIFWEHALNLLVDSSCVVEVTFEANGPKAFDDVVVRYDPPVARPGPDRVPAEYTQVKWHVETGGRFGYEDFRRRLGVDQLACSRCFAGRYAEPYGVLAGLWRAHR